MTKTEPAEPNFINNHSSKPDSVKPRKKRIWLWIVAALAILFILMKYFFISGMKVEATVKALKESEIRTAADGFLSEIRIENAQKANGGEVLFVFENDGIQNSLSEALQKKKNLEADLKQWDKVREHSRKVMESARILLENGVIGRLEFEKAELDYFSNENAYKEIRREQKELIEQIKILYKEKRKLKIVAPYDGYFLGELNLRQNTFFKKGEALGIFYDPRHFYVEAFVPEKDAQYLKVGDNTQTLFKALPGIYAGKITQIDAKVREKIEKVFKIKHVVRVLILLDEAPKGLKPGMRGLARIHPGMTE